MRILKICPSEALGAFRVPMKISPNWLPLVGCPHWTLDKGKYLSKARWTVQGRWIEWTPDKSSEPISFARSESDWSLLKFLDIFARQPFVQQIRASISSLQAIKDPVVAENYFSQVTDQGNGCNLRGLHVPSLFVSLQVPYRIIEITQLVSPRHHRLQP